MTTALYATIWLALILFIVGDTGRSLTTRRAHVPRWAWRAFVAGWILAVVHTLIAFGSVHGWSFTAALQRTAQQTEAIYGTAFGGGLYVNYLFLAVWLWDAWWWRSSPALRRSTAVVWTLRAFYMVIIFNAVVVFTTVARRVGGVILVCSLTAVWAATIRMKNSERSEITSHNRSRKTAHTV